MITKKSIGKAFMKRIHLFSMAFIIGIAQPVHTHAMQSKHIYVPAIVFASGTALSAATAFWASRKINKLNNLSVREKENPEVKKNLTWWENVKNKSIVIASACGMCTLAAINLIASLKERERRENRNGADQGHENPRAHGGDENSAAQQEREKERKMREQARKKMEDNKRKAEEKRKKDTEAAKKRNVDQIKTDELIIRLGAKDNLINAAQNGDLAAIQNLVNQFQEDSRPTLLNVRDGDRKTAWYYARRNNDRAILTYALEQAAHLAVDGQGRRHVCGICREQINNPLEYAVGSPSFNCLDFFCVRCLNQARGGYRYESNFEGNILANHFAGRGQRCPTCNLG